MKKKTSVYFLAPIVGLLLFGAVYWRFLSGYELKQIAKTEEAKHKKEELKRLADQKQKEAYDSAFAANEKNKKDTADRLAREAAKKEQRQNAIAEQRKVESDADRVGRQIEKLARDVADLKKEVEDFDAQKAKAGKDAAHYADLAKQADATQKELMAAIVKVQQADDARREAERQAAIAAAAAKK